MNGYDDIVICSPCMDEKIGSTDDSSDDIDIVTTTSYYPPQLYNMHPVRAGVILSQTNHVIIVGVMLMTI